MSDIFQEVEEDLRREQFSRLWKKYGVFVIAGAVAIVVVAAAIVGWRSWREHEARAASLKYQTIVRAGEEDATVLTPEAAKSLESTATKLPGGYRRIADLERAAAYVAARDYNQAIAIYDALSKDASAARSLRDVAVLKSAYLQAESLSLAQMKSRVEALAVPASGFRFSANELLGYTAYRTGDYKAARDYFQAIIADAAAPQSLRQRAEDLLGLTMSRMPAVEPAPQAAPATNKD